ncbi:beta strand repeat-containing protein [Belnapia moabensis]|uniref:beta strand repeat-containing protein n=1 Tax=Belnapia moabensis TaxID=365533 RepID=UPI0005BBC618|nr:calcium-binding protein [Belnapia moabensis]
MATISGNPGSDTLTGTTANDLFLGSAGSDAIIGGGGYDALDYSNLAPGNSLTVTMGQNGLLTVAKAGLGMDSAFGISQFMATDGNDSFVSYKGQAGAYIDFAGLSGNDTINGQGDYYVTAIYSRSPSGTAIDLQAGTASDGYGTTDTLIDVRRARGSDYADTIKGGAAADIFWASFGNDSYDGRGGTNNLTYTYSGVGPLTVVMSSLSSGMVMKAGGGGADTFTNIGSLDATDGNDSILGVAATAGQSGYAMLAGHGGNDTIDGALNYANVVTYNVFGTATGVVANLGSGTASDGQGGTDSLRNVRGLQGSSFADVITGSTGSDVFFATTGSDSYSGAGGQDQLNYSLLSGSIVVTLTSLIGGTVFKTYDGSTDSFSVIGSFIGSTGNDIFRTGTANTTIAGGGGTDVLDYSNQAGAVTRIQVTWTGIGSGTVTKFLVSGATATDKFSSISRVVGTSGADMLTGSLGDEIFFPLGGNDTIIGGGGTDRLSYASYYGQPTGSQGVKVDLTAQTATDSFGNVETLSGIRNVDGSPFNDTLKGVSIPSGAAGLSGYPNSGTNFGGSAGSDLIDGAMPLTSNVINYGTYAGPLTIAFSDHLHAIATKGSSGTDTLTYINTVIGTSGNDSIAGSPTAMPAGSYGNSLIEAAPIVLTTRRSGIAGAERWSGSAAAAWQGYAYG